MQVFDIGLVELQKDMSVDNLIIQNLYVYTDCAPGDQKNRFMLSHLSKVLNNNRTRQWCGPEVPHSTCSPSGWVQTVQ